MNKTVYLSFLKLELSKILMYCMIIWYDYVKPEYHAKAKLYT